MANIQNQMLSDDILNGDKARFEDYNEEQLWNHFWTYVANTNYYMDYTKDWNAWCDIIHRQDLKEEESAVG